MFRHVCTVAVLPYPVQVGHGTSRPGIPDDGNHDPTVTVASIMIKFCVTAFLVTVTVPPAGSNQCDD